MKFGQAWKYANVVFIIPGFASIYRTSVLGKISMNPHGLVIEDYNMTFEVQHKKLGKIVHDLRVVAYTQDPDNLYDYYRQIKRWYLGLWQTIRLHGLWPSKFWAAMSLTLLETIMGSFIFFFMPMVLVIGSFILPYSTSPDLKYLTAVNVLVILATDYLLTLVVAGVQGRKEYLLAGLVFPFIRFFDSMAFLMAIPRAFFVKSTGQWTSPSRRGLG